MFSVSNIPYNVSVKSLQMCLIFPNTTEKNLRKFYVKTSILRILTLGGVLVGVISHFIKIQMDHIDEIDTSEDLLALAAGFGTMFIMGMTTFLHKRWEQLVKDVVDDSKFDKPEAMDKIIYRNNLFATCFASYFIAGGFVYAYVTYREQPNCHRVIEEKNINLQCDTFLPMWYPIKIPQYIQYIIFLLQFILVQFDLFSVAMLVFVTFESTEILKGHFEQLGKDFHKIVNYKNLKTRRAGISYWVTYHNHVIRMTGELNYLSKKTVAYVTLIAALVIACAENMLISNTKPLAAILFLIGWNVGTFILCHSGENINQLMAALHDAVYTSDWHKIDNETKKDIVFILFRCQRPLTLDALPLGVINYALFVLLIKTSYSYLTLLNQSA